jgi:hypothetical protein
MSANTKNSPIFASNSNENIIVSNEQSYDDLIGYCALRKQFARIIPSYYTEIQNKPINNKRKNISNMEEYKKLKEEINIMKESIELLKESKQKKLKQIEDLRVLMRKVGNKQINNNEKKHIINTINNNYCSREKQDTTQNVRSERKDSNGFKASSDEGLSLAPTTSGLSSAQDDDMGGEGIPKPDGANYYSSSGSWCFVYEDLPSKENLLNNPERKAAALASN